MDSNIQHSVRSLALLSVLAGTMALTTEHVANAGQPPPNSQAKQIQGAWILQVSAHDCQTGAPVSNFQSLVTFAQGGTLTNVTTGGNPALRTTGLGTWEKVGGHEFTAVTMVFLFSPAGAWAATQRIANTFELGSNRDELTGTTEVNFFDTNGNLTSTVCATVLGRRLGVSSTSEDD
jgi:hypothetical protein